jgi:hypothetical protein
MNWRFSGLVLLALTVSRAPATLRHLAEGAGLGAAPYSSVTTHSDVESVFAVGGRVPLSCIDVSTLELIRGVSDKLAFSIIDARAQIFEAASRGVSDERALQRARGVGEAIAATLRGYITLSGSCNEPGLPGGPFDSPAYPLDGEYKVIDNTQER